MLEAGRRDHVQDTLPDLVEAIEPGAPTTLQQPVKACRGRIQDHRAHDHKRTEEPLDGHLMTCVPAAQARWMLLAGERRAYR